MSDGDIFPEHGQTNAETATVDASCDVKVYTDCPQATDHEALGNLILAVARLGNIGDQQWDCSDHDTLLNNVQNYIQNSLTEDANVPCLSTDLAGVVPAGPQPNIWIDDTGGVGSGATLNVWSCEDSTYLSTSFGPGTEFNPCSFPAFNPASDTLDDTDTVIVCDGGAAKQIDVSDLRNVLGGGGVLVAMAFRDYDPNFPIEINGSGFNVQSVQQNIQPGKRYDLTFINPPPAGRYMFVTHLTEADINNNENPLLAPQYITYSGSGPIDTPFPANFNEDFFFYIYGPITNY